MTSPPIGKYYLTTNVFQVIKTTATKVDICALLTGLSPMQKKRFTGELVDEHTSIRCVGFDAAKQIQLSTFNNKKPVLLQNCNIQLNSYSKSLEVMIKGYTRITESPRKFDVDNPAEIGTNHFS